jgi:flagellar biosynthesis/type III secretory pathway chaperone
LERFCQECSKYNFIIESREFQIFAHEGGEVTEKLEKMPKQSPKEILEKFRQNFPKIQEESPNDMAAFRERIAVFSNFLSKCQQANMTNREQMMSSVKNHSQNNQDVKQLY